MFCLSFIWSSLPNGTLLFWVKNLGQTHLRIEQTAPLSHWYLSFPVGLIEYMVHTPSICYHCLIGFCSYGNCCSLCCPLPNFRVFLRNVHAQVSVPTPDLSWPQPWAHKSRIFPDIKIPCAVLCCLDYVKSIVLFACFFFFWKTNKQKILNCTWNPGNLCIFGYNKLLSNSASNMTQNKRLALKEMAEMVRNKLILRESL